MQTDFSFSLSADEADIAARARNFGNLGAPNPAADYEGRNREIVEQWWAEGRREFEIRKRRENKPYDRAKVLSGHWMAPVLSKTQRLSTQALLRDHGFVGALNIIAGTIEILSAQHRAVITRGQAGEWTYDRNQQLALSDALFQERKLRGQIAAMAEANEKEAA